MTEAEGNRRPLDEEVRDILIAISVIAKRLATKLEDRPQEMEEQNGRK